MKGADFTSSPRAQSVTSGVDDENLDEKRKPNQLYM